MIVNILTIEKRQSLATPHEYMIFESDGRTKKPIDAADTWAQAERLRDQRQLQLNKAELDRLARRS
jgi:hypothetical protein